jgi:hypothetical protein
MAPQFALMIPTRSVMSTPMAKRLMFNCREDVRKADHPLNVIPPVLLQYRPGGAPLRHRHGDAFSRQAGWKARPMRLKGDRGPGAIA